MFKKILYLLLLILVFVCSGFLVSCGGASESLEESEGYYEKVDDGSMTKEEAQATGGVYVLTAEDKYYPAREGMNLMYSADHLLFTETSSDIPVVNQGDKLVVFTALTIDESKSRTVFPVTQTGYTIPVYKEAENDDWEVSNLYYDDQPMGYGTQLESVDGLQEVERNVNYIDSDSLCSEERGECKRPYNCKIFIFDNIKDVVVGYYSGSYYEELVFTSDIQYFVYNSCVKGGSYSEPSSSFTGIPSQISLTDQGYAIIDTDHLDPGLYIVKAGDDKEYYSSGKDDSQEGFVFEKK